jgi:hypothetical protein
MYTMLKRQLSHLKSCKLDRHQVYTSYIFYAWLRLVLCCKHDHSHAFMWPLLAVCIILLYNHIHRKVESCMQSWTGVHLGKFPMVQRTMFCMCCNLKRWVSIANSQARQAQVIIDLISALWRVHLMLVLKCSLLNRELVLINVLKALASIISMCSLHVILLSNITQIYSTWLTKRMFHLLNVR